MEPDKVKCYYCAEEILAEAKKCKHCGEWLKPQFFNEVKNNLNISEKLESDSEQNTINNKETKNFQPPKIINVDKNIREEANTINKKEYSNSNKLFQKSPKLIFYLLFLLFWIIISLIYPRLFLFLALIMLFLLLSDKEHLKSKKFSFWFFVIGSIITIFTSSKSLMDGNFHTNSTPPNSNIPDKAPTYTYITKSGYLAAYTKDDFNLALRLLDDKPALEKLFNTGRAFPLPPGMKVFLVKGGIGTVIIRPEGQTSEIWVSHEAIEENF